MAEQEVEQQVPLELAFDVPADMPARFATNIVVQRTEQEFIVSFFEVHPPILLGSPESNRVQLQALGSVTAHCIGRFVITPSRMRDFVDVLKRNVEGFFASKEAKAE